MLILLATMWHITGSLQPLFSIIAILYSHILATAEKNCLNYTVIYDILLLDYRRSLVSICMDAFNALL